ncbi:MAG: flagellar FlbD family protein [Terriglobia bacterium]|jgi:flagellar protein FlbD|nr:flagellar FlbD family protein [Terriglobia bacterium]
MKKFRDDLRSEGVVIQLTRLNNQPLVVNADLIKLVEQAPDTVITLVTGEKLVVRESTEEVVRRVVVFRRELLADLHGAAKAQSSGEAEREPPHSDPKKA